MVARPTVCKPTQLGGLGVSDIRLQGFALQTRCLWLQRTDQQRAWSQLPIKTVPEVQAFFRASTHMEIGDGRQALFWEDKWIQEESIRDIAPCLYQIIPPSTRSSQTVREGLTNRRWVRAITGGPSWTALEEYLKLWDIMENIQLSDHPDRLVWQWTADGDYTAKSAYQMLHNGATTFLGHRLIWKT